MPKFRVDYSYDKEVSDSVVIDAPDLKTADVDAVEVLRDLLPDTLTWIDQIEEVRV